MNSKPATNSSFYSYVRWPKRLLDITLAFTLLVILSPALVVIAILVKTKIGSPVFFRQMRPGFKGQPFEILKFRTMRDVKDSNGRLLPDEERITEFGESLRRFSLDELPQLINVLQGRMSLIGPRPQLMEYADKYTAEQMRRHDVRPGITGWAQVHGRNDTTWEERFAYDLWYVDRCSFSLDLRILIKTVAVVLSGEGGVDRSSQLEYYGERSQRSDACRNDNGD